MNNLKKLFQAILSVCFLCCVGSASTQPCPGQFELGLEYLYLYNNSDDPFFVIQGDSTSLVVVDGGTRKNNPVGFKSAFRIEGIYAFCNSCDPTDFRVRWLYYTGKGHRKVTSAPQILWATIVSNSSVVAASRFAGTADFEIDVMHHNLECLFGKKILNCGNFDMFLRAGIQYAYGRNAQQFKVFNPVLAQENAYRLRFSGVGPELVFEGDYGLCAFERCMPGYLSLRGLLSTSLLVSNCQGKFIENRYTVVPEVSYNVKDESNWRIVPQFSIRFGLNYETCICSLPTSLELGYDVTSYIRALPQVRFTSGVLGTSFINFSNFDLHGPYANLSMVF